MENLDELKLDTSMEIMEWLKISKPTFYKMIREGLPRYNVCSDFRFVKREVLDFIRNKEIVSNE